MVLAITSAHMSKQEQMQIMTLVETKFTDQY